MSLLVVIPWQGGCEARRLNLRWLTRRLAGEGRQIRLAEIPEGRPWCKPAAVRLACELADAEVVAIHDADVWSPGLDEAHQAVLEGAPWAVPHRRVHRLTASATLALHAGEVPSPAMACTRRPYRGTAAGGIVVLRRDTVLQVPPDARFVGWGGEDAAWRDALRCLAGMEWRGGDAPLYHLWHPPAPRDGHRHGSPEHRDLVRRYADARRDPLAMRVLLAEAERVTA